VHREGEKVCSDLHHEPEGTPLHCIDQEVSADQTPQQHLGSSLARGLFAFVFLDKQIKRERTLVGLESASRNCALCTIECSADGVRDAIVLGTRRAVENVVDELGTLVRMIYG
jgi:hypothetical protein